MKIAVITNSLSGLYNFRYEVMDALSSENELHIYVPLRNNSQLVAKKFEKHSDIKIKNISLDSRGINPFKEIKTLREIRQIKRNKYNFILTYTIKPNIYTSLFFRNNNTDVVANVTGLGQTILNNPSSILSNVFLHIYTKSLLKNKINFIQNKDIYNLFIAKEPKLKNRLKVIPGSGVNLSKYSFSPYPPIANNTIKILFIGRIIKSKGIYELLKAAEIISRTATKYHYEFFVAGFLPPKFDVQLFTNKVKYIGQISNPHDVYSQVHFVINPSYHEGMSNVLLEAASTGRPLLASDIPGCREIVSNRNGFLFEPRNENSIVDSILKIDTLTYGDFKKMGIQSRKLVEKKFDRQIIIEKYLEVIKDGKCDN